MGEKVSPVMTGVEDDRLCGGGGGGTHSGRVLPEHDVKEIEAIQSGRKRIHV